MALESQVWRSLLPVTKGSRLRNVNVFREDGRAWAVPGMNSRILPMAPDEPSRIDLDPGSSTPFDNYPDMKMATATLREGRRLRNGERSKGELYV